MANVTWIKLHSNVFTHKKTYVLADMLNLKVIYAAAHVIKLWTWAVDNAKDGDLSEIPNRMIAKAAEWTKNADLFVNSCIEAGWLDQDESGNIKIHDWEDYTDTLIKRRERDAERKRKERQLARGRPQDVQRTSKGHPEPERREEKRRVYSNNNSSSNNSSRGSNIQVDMSAAADEKTAVENEQVVAVLKAYEQDIGIPSGTVSQKLQMLITDDQLDPGLVTAAIAEAALFNKRSFKYIESILKRCQSEGIKTAEQFKASRLPTPVRKRDPTAVEDYSWGQDPGKVPDFMGGDLKT